MGAFTTRAQEVGNDADTAPDEHGGSVAERLAALDWTRTCLIGIGNRYRHDDGAGSLLAERLAGRINSAIIDAGVAPENSLEKAARRCPEIVLLVDATDFGAAPGSLRIVEPGDVAASGLSSHALSLGMAATYLKARTGAGVLLLAIQPAEIGAGEGLTAPVAGAVERLYELIVRASGAPGDDDD